MQKSHILYIDDDLTSLKVFEGVFREKFYVHTLESVFGAEEVFKKYEIKVLLCDQQMPDENGLDFFKRIKDKYSNVSYVLVTGHAEIDLAVETINTGIVNSFITKPWKKNEVEINILNGIKAYDLKVENNFLLKSLQKQNKELEEFANRLIQTSMALNHSKKEIKVKDDGIKKIITNSYSKGENYFFQNMVLNINDVLGADYTFIAKLKHNNSLETIAFCHNNEIIENITGSLENSPCYYVIESCSFIVDNNIKENYGHTDIVKQLNLNSYIGIPVYSLSGIPIGVLVSLFKSEIKNESFCETVFELFATNIGAELERRTILNELKDSQIKLNNIFSSISDSIFVHPLHNNVFGNFIEVNPYACERYGYTKAELLKMSPVDLIWQQESSSSPHQSFKQFVNKAGRLTFETIHVTKAGVKFPVEISSNAVPYNGGLMIWAVVRDISERIKTANDLKESETKFKQFFNRSTDAIFVADVKSGIIVDANETACMKTGYKYDEIIGLHQTDLHPEHFSEKSRQLFKNQVVAVIKGQKVRPLNSLLKDKQGHEIPVEVSANLVSINGKPHILGIFRDISQRKKAEQKLLESENRYKTTFVTSPDAVVLTNSEGVLIDVNDVFLDYSGYTRKQAIGKSLVELKLWKNDSDRLRFLDDIKKHGAIKNYEFTFVSKQGHDLVALVSAKSFIMNNEPHNLTVAREISERKQMEQEILENEQLLNKVFESAPYIVALLNSKREVVKINLDYSEKNEPIIRRIGAIFKCVAYCRVNNHESKYKHCVGCCIEDQFKHTYNTGESVVKQQMKIRTGSNNDSELRYYLISTSLIKRKLKKYVLLTIDDVTDQKNTENELLKSKEKAEYNEKRYSLLSDLTFEGIVLHDKTNIIDVNKALQKLSGYTKKELIGANIFNLLFEEKYHHIIRKKINSKYTAPYEIYLQRKDSRVVPVEIEAQDFMLRNKSLRVAAIRDITERKESEKLVLQAIVNTEEQQKIKFAQELHDGLGPLLSNVQMYFQWLADEDENKDFVLEKGLASLKNAFSSLREISNNLSPHVLHDFGLTKALKHFVNAMPEVDHQILSVYSKIKDTRYNKEVEVALYRIVTELINNANKYANAENIIINLEEQKEQICLNYTDDGVGFNIDEEEALNSGNGLLNIKNRVKTLNGTFELKSSPGKGVDVKIKVPSIMIR